MSGSLPFAWSQEFAAGVGGSTFGLGPAPWVLRIDNGGAWGRPGIC